MYEPYGCAYTCCSFHSKLKQLLTTSLLQFKVQFQACTFEPAQQDWPFRIRTNSHLFHPFPGWGLPLFAFRAGPGIIKVEAVNGNTALDRAGRGRHSEPFSLPQRPLSSTFLLGLVPKVHQIQPVSPAVCYTTVKGLYDLCASTCLGLAKTGDKRRCPKAPRAQRCLVLRALCLDHLASFRHPALPRRDLRAGMSGSITRDRSVQPRQPSLGLSHALHQLPSPSRR